MKNPTPSLTAQQRLENVTIELKNLYAIAMALRELIKTHEARLVFQAQIQLINGEGHSRLNNAGGPALILSRSPDSQELAHIRSLSAALESAPEFKEACETVEQLLAEIAKENAEKQAAREEDVRNARQLRAEYEAACAAEMESAKLCASRRKMEEAEKKIGRDPDPPGLVAAKRIALAKAQAEIASPTVGQRLPATVIYGTA